MKNYAETFLNLRKKGQGALVAFTVIGYPDYGTSLRVAKTFIDSGADILELGMPFSDPIADGPTIQSADMQALENGMNTKKAFSYISELRKYSDIPIGILTYCNIAYQRGFGNFYANCGNAGVNSVLIADLPIEESAETEKQAKLHGIDTVFMASPLTDDKRIKSITARTTGFVYAVSRLGVTGARESIEEPAVDLLKRIRKTSNIPICVGFGISKPAHARSFVKAGADGVIVGSAFIDLIGKCMKKEGRITEALGSYVKSMKESTI